MSYNAHVLLVVATGICLYYKSNNDCEQFLQMVIYSCRNYAFTNQCFFSITTKHLISL